MAYQHSLLVNVEQPPFSFLDLTIPPLQVSPPSNDPSKLSPSDKVLHINEIKGYDPAIFFHQELLCNWICAICKNVLKQPYSIGCSNDHLFCLRCTQKHFSRSNNDEVSCPSCADQGLVHRNIKEQKNAKRFIMGLTIRCPLQHKNKNDKQKCDFKGALSSLVQHLIDDCPLAWQKCEDGCNMRFPRFDIEWHDNECAFKRVACLLCHGLIQRNQHKSHIAISCPMKKVECKHCKKLTERVHLFEHVIYCDEKVVSCSFHTFGCKKRFPRKFMKKHEDEFKFEHLSMKVDTMNRDVQLLKKKNTTQERVIAGLQETVEQQRKKLKRRLQTLDMDNNNENQRNRRNAKRMRRT